MAQGNVHWPEMPHSFDGSPDASLYQNYSQADSYLPQQRTHYETPAHHHHHHHHPGRLSFGASFSGPNATHTQSSPGSHELSAPSLTSAHAHARSAPHHSHHQPTVSSFASPTQLGPMDRWVQEQPSWSMAPRAEGADPTNNAGPTFTTPSHPVVRPPAAPLPPYPGYRDPGLGARSNPESSHVTDSRGGAAADSGYGTGTHHHATQTRSHASGVDYGGGDVVDDAQSFVQDLGAMDIQHQGLGSAAHVAATYYTMGGPPHQQGSAPPPPPHPGQAMEEPPPEPGVELQEGLVCEQDECAGHWFKNQSELRKHKQRHDKTHRCDVPGCTRTVGFSTKNDLDRHRKSKHNIRPPNCSDRSFKCMGAHCNKRMKLWPRLDNFKAHCTRMHKNENLDELLRRSEIVTESEAGDPPPPPPPPPPPSAESRVLPAPEPLRKADPVMASPNTMLAGLTEAQQHHARFPGETNGSTDRHTDAAVLIELAVADDPGRAERNASRLRRSETPRASSQQQQNNVIVVDESDSIPMPPSPNVARSDAGRAPVSSCDSSYVTAQLSGSRKRKLSNGALMNPNKRIAEISKDLTSKLANVQHFSPESMRPLLEAGFRDLMDLATTANSADRGSSPSPDDARDHGAGKAKGLACSICHKVMDRQCDLKKHEKRHSRPWGCTNPTCARTFGSKNDWKRHENSQHYQLETWRCHEASATSKIGQCAKIFFRRDPFQAHLRREHSVRDDEYVREQSRRRRVGRNFQNGFWCGFCKAIVRLQTKGLEAWDERFNHIDDAHFKRGQCIDDWYPMDRDLPKGRLLRRAAARKLRRQGRGSTSGDSRAGDLSDAPSNVFGTESDDDDAAFERDVAAAAPPGRGRSRRAPAAADALDAMPPPEPPPPDAQPRLKGGGPCYHCRQGWIRSAGEVCEFCNQMN